MSVLAIALLAFASARDPLAHPPSSTAVPLTTGGLVWIRELSLPFPYLALGDRGGQVFASCGDGPLRLFSSFDSSPPAEIWTAPPTQRDLVVGASESDAYLHLRVRMGHTFGTIGVLRMFRSRASRAEWRFDFPEQDYSVPVFDISRDGRTIVSVFSNDAANVDEIRIHDPATGIVLQTHTAPNTGGLSRCDLSPDGTVVAFYSLSGTTEIYEVGTWAHLGSLSGGIQGNQALSEGGGVAATFEWVAGSGLHVRAHERTPGGYQQVLDIATPAHFYPQDIVVSDNGATLAAGWWDSGTPRRAIVRAYDVATQTMTMEHVDTAGTNLDIFPSSLSIDARGMRFVVGEGSNGSFGPFPEIAIYSPTSSTPLRAHAQGGDVFQVEISPDGKRYAASRGPVSPGDLHSYLEMYEFGGEDFVVRGTPSVGATIDFELHASPASRAWLLRSFALAPTPIAFPGVGTLQLDPATLSRTSMGVVPASGVATHSMIATTFPGMIGRTLWYQGLTTNPRTLSNDFVQLTIVP